MTKRYDKDKLYRALVSALWYNVGLGPIEDLYEKLKALKDDDYSLSFHDVDEAWYDDKELNTY
jgi:hypothetical protein